MSVFTAMSLIEGKISYFCEHTIPLAPFPPSTVGSFPSLHSVSHGGNKRPPAFDKKIIIIPEAYLLRSDYNP